jgi:two-component system response regulator PilR (NtrC family)
MAEQTVLIVDDEPDIRELLEITLGRMGLETIAVGTLEAARSALAERGYALCLTDMRLPDGDGLDLVDHINRTYPGTPVAVITAHGNMDAAVKALKSGAFDFVAKPVELEDLRSLVTQALRLEEPGDPPSDTSTRLIGRSPAIESLRTRIAKVARSQAPVVITGESGSGKELVARLIHEQGPRGERPFVPVNCGAIPRELMESEFFGHRRGAFTGANSDRDGLFAAAEGGTLFLDEIVELPPDMQVKLLRAIQEKRIRPVGATSEQPVDTRIVCATHADLEQAVRDGDFREDLFYRVHVISLRVPPLRERGGDVAAIADHILARLGDEYQTGAVTLTDDAYAALRAHSFPGNVRELENVLERALTLADGNRIGAEDLQLAPAIAGTSEGTAKETTPDAAAAQQTERAASIDAQIEDNQRRLLTESLERNRWNRTASAQELGLTYRQLRYRLKKLGID